MEDKEAKQFYLQQEIIDKDFDSDLFTLWIAAQKHEGTDVDNWTFEDLIKVVKEFQENNPPGNTPTSRNFSILSQLRTRPWTSTRSSLTRKTLPKTDLLPIFLI